jgi:hypothetical protein
MNAVSFGHGPSLHAPQLHIVMPSPSTLLGSGFFWFQNLWNECSYIDSWEDEVMLLVKMWTNDESVCDVLRYLFAIPAVFRPLYAAIGWTTYNPAPYAGANCAAPPDDHWCGAIKFYYVLMGFMAVLFGIIAIVEAFKRFIPDVIRLVVWIVKKIFEAIAFLFHCLGVLIRQTTRRHDKRIKKGV